MPTACMRLSMRRLRLVRLYPVKSNPRPRRRKSGRVSRSFSGSSLRMVGTSQAELRRTAGPRSSLGLTGRPRLRPRVTERPGLAEAVTLDQEAPHQLGRIAGLGGLFLEAGRGDPVAPLPGRAGQPPRERGPLLEAAKGDPQCRLQLLALLAEQALRRPGVADPAAEADQVAVVQFPEDAVAVRAGERRGATRIVPLDGAHGEIGHPVLDLQESRLRRERRWWLLGIGVSGEPGDLSGDGVRRQAPG